MKETKAQAMARVQAEFDRETEDRLPPCDVIDIWFDCDPEFSEWTDYRFIMRMFDVQPGRRVCAV